MIFSFGAIFYDRISYLCTMNRLLNILAIIVAMMYFSCVDHCDEQEYQRNKAELMRIRNKVRHQKSIADETGIDSLIVFFEDHGTNEDILTARFCNAWYLWRIDDLNQAYLAFRELKEDFPKDHSETEEEMLRSVYTMLQLISAKENDLNSAEAWWNEANASGVFSKAYQYVQDYNKGWIMYDKGNIDSCVYYMDRSFEALEKLSDWDDNKSLCLSEQTAYFAMLGDIQGFKRRNKLLKLHPYLGENRSVDLNTGLMLLKEGKRDSAIYYFNKATSSTDEVALAAYAQLAIDANNNGKKDLLFGYYQHSMERWNNLFLQKSESFTKRLEMNYRNQELSMQLAQQKIHVLILLLCFTVTLLLAITGWWLNLVLRRKRQNDLLRLDNAKKEKEELEIQLQKVLTKIRMKSDSISTQKLEEKKLRLEALAIELKQYAEKKLSAPHLLCEEFVRVFAEMNNEKILKLQEHYASIKPNDILLCLLAVMNFKLTEIAYITNYDRQEVRQFMLRISKGLTGEPIGRMADFKTMLDERFFGRDVR